MIDNNATSNLYDPEKTFSPNQSESKGSNNSSNSKDPREKTQKKLEKIDRNESSDFKYQNQGSNLRNENNKSKMKNNSSNSNLFNAYKNDDCILIDQANSSCNMVPNRSNPRHDYSRDISSYSYMLQENLSHLIRPFA